jgi:peptidoglycan-associated lipoprotein
LVPGDLRIVMGEDAVGRLIFSYNDFVYLGKGRDGGVSVGQRFLVVRPVDDPSLPEAEAFKDQNKMSGASSSGGWYKEEYRGQYYKDIGQVEVTAVHPTSAIARVTHACEALGLGDLVIPFRERPYPEYKPDEEFDRFAAPSGLPVGVLMAGKEFTHAFGQGSVVYVSLGSRDGVVVGDYVRLFRPAHNTAYNGYRKVVMGQWKRYRGVAAQSKPLPTGKRKDLPRESMGEALVVNVQEKVSTALVTFSLREFHAGDFVELLPPAPPQAILTVDPPSIPRGASATLSWSARLADQLIEIRPAPGAVTSRRGTRNVSPTQTTTYTLLTRGRGGEAQATATLTVVQPPPPPPPPPPVVEPSLVDLFAENVRDIFFEFDRADITAEAAAALERTAAFLRDYPQARILIEGHCDEIGTDQYNLALGARRAAATRDYLVSLGVSAAQLDTVSKGRTRQFCAESLREDCRRLNRRAHFVLQP